ncbi:hypothetical protein [Maribellus luteus]|uniref:hypothetical protein n=1 Tax=Maribellus luteus TaxID=2305463 RepID=UPI0019D45799|nr:hypothetical protein [Maribellus luteus]
MHRNRDLMGFIPRPLGRIKKYHAFDTPPACSGVVHSSGWWVGYVERSDNVYFFATRLEKDRETPNPDFGKCRKEITRTILRQLNVIDYPAAIYRLFLNKQGGLIVSFR